MTKMVLLEEYMDFDLEEHVSYKELWKPVEDECFKPNAGKLYKYDRTYEREFLN